MAELRAENERIKAVPAQGGPSTPRAVWISLGVASVLGVTAILSAFVLSGSTGEAAAILMVILMVLALTLATITLTVSRLLFVATPNEVLVISGRRVVAADGSVRGYRLVRGGRAMRLPLLERVDRMDLTAMALEITLRNACTKGGMLVDVTAHAVARIAKDEPLLNNAVERFLGRDRQLVMDAASQTLEGVLRGLVATLSVDELRQDQLKIAAAVLHEAENEFGKLGLELDVFKVAQVSPRDGS